MNPADIRVWAITGVPGAGKTELARRLAARTGRQHVQTGDMARAIDPVAMAAGKLADTASLERVFRAEMAGMAGTELILDGIPRYEEQVPWLPLGTLVFLLRCRVDVATDRLSRRGRDDDTPDLIRQRVDNQFALLEPWAGDLAGWERCLNTTNRTADQVEAGVWAYCSGKKREVY